MACIANVERWKYTVDLGVSIKVILGFGVCVFVCINEMKKNKKEERVANDWFVKGGVGELV